MGIQALLYIHTQVIEYSIKISSNRKYTNGKTICLLVNSKISRNYILVSILNPDSLEILEFRISSKMKYHSFNLGYKFNLERLLKIDNRQLSFELLHTYKN